MQGRVWKALVDMELERQNLDAAVELFGKSLLQCYNVPLWTSYMDFIKKVCPSVASAYFETSLQEVNCQSPFGTGPHVLINYC